MKLYIYSIALLFLSLSSCIENDIPYPHIPGEILEFEVEGQIGEAKIDKGKRTVEIVIDELVEQDSLKIKKLITNEEAIIKPDSMACVDINKFPDFSFASLASLPANANTSMNFSSPVKILLQTYQDYWWTVTVKQIVNRTINVENQVGPAVIDEINRIALVYVSESQSLKNIRITEMSLEGKNSKTMPDPATVSDFSRPQKFELYRNYTYGNTTKEKFIGTWTVDIAHTESSSSTGDTEAWGHKAIISGGMKSGSTPTIEYKKQSDNDWKQLETSAVSILTPTSFKATIKGLTDGTTYQWRAVVDGVAGSIATFTTEKIEVIPNLNFDTWTQSGKNWYANPVANNYDAPGAYWATGNEGVTSSLAGSKDPISFPVEGGNAYKGKAACLKSITGVTLVGAAAGNLLIGKYKTNMMSPSKSVEFGRSYSGARPTRLSGYYKYSPAAINNDGTKPGNLITDQCHIYLKLWDASGNEFAYGEFVGSEKVDSYTKFTFDIEYKDLKARPAMITIVATSSRYGGEFEGSKVVGQVGDGSTLFVDEFELFYD